MLAKQFASRRSLNALRLATQTTQQQRFAFSTDEGEKTAEPASSKKVIGDSEWGIKYDDECLKFEQEWKIIADKVEAEQSVYLEQELSELQRKKVDLLTDKMLDLNVFELRYMSVAMKQRMQRTSGINPLKLNMDWPSVKQDDAGTWPPMNPNWFKQQELMSQLGPFMGAMGGGGGAAPAGQQAAAAEAAPEEKVEEVAEKTHFDIELSSFDASSKIKVIKEIRGILGLGLKEAKELVESAPQWIVKEMKKEDAEAIQEKLKAVGAEVKLV